MPVSDFEGCLVCPDEQRCIQGPSERPVFCLYHHHKSTPNTPRFDILAALQAERDAIAAEVERDGGNQMFVEIADRMIEAAKGAGR